MAYGGLDVSAGRVAAKPVQPRRVARTPPKVDLSSESLAGNGQGGGHRGAAYRQIKEAILTGALRPLERITEEHIAERLGLSRTPVREAFAMLEAERLIVILAKRGGFVAPLSFDDILEMYQIRIPLECMTARIAAETISEEDLVKLEQLVESELGRNGKRSVPTSLARSQAFQEIVNSCAHNNRLEALLKELQGQTHRARGLLPSTAARLNAMWQDHAQLLVALKAGDAEAAERLTRQRLQRASAGTLAQMMRKTV
jgi:DNA-binding GntR family transcriptional regulator